MLTFKMAAIRLRDWIAFLYQKYYYFSPPVFFLGISSEYETVSSLFMRVLLSGIQDSRYIVVHALTFSATVHVVIICSLFTPATI